MTRLDPHAPFISIHREKMLAIVEKVRKYCHSLPPQAPLFHSLEKTLVTPNTLILTLVISSAKNTINNSDMDCLLSVIEQGLGVTCTIVGFKMQKQYLSFSLVMNQMV